MQSHRGYSVVSFPPPNPFPLGSRAFPPPHCGEVFNKTTITFFFFVRNSCRRVLSVLDPFHDSSGSECFLQGTCDSSCGLGDIRSYLQQLGHEPSSLWFLKSQFPCGLQETLIQAFLWLSISNNLYPSTNELRSVAFVFHAKILHFVYSFKSNRSHLKPVSLLYRLALLSHL